jgi:hypothetical protein
MTRHRQTVRSLATAAGLTMLATGPAAAASTPKPSAKACSESPDGGSCACMRVKDRTVPSGRTVTFAGTLSPMARKHLKQWTKGDKIVCVDRFNTTPEADGSWPWQTTEGVCTTVRKDGSFILKAELGRKGTYYYGLEMGPCRADDDRCGNADPILLGIDDTVVSVRTT